MPTADPTRVLVVDDNPFVRDAVVLALLALKHKPMAAADGREGLQIFSANPFDLVMTDLQMPAMDGWELTRRIKQLAPHVPVVAMTGQDRHSVLPDLPGSGIARVLFKPFGVHEIAATLDRVLEDRASVGGKRRRPADYEVIREHRA